MVGLKVFATSKSIIPYDMMIIISPTATRLAAGPFKQTALLPRTPFIT